MIEAATWPTVYFYRKEDCELCDRMAQAIDEFRQEFSKGADLDVVERDIEDRREWFSRYREYVPVLVVDGEEICHYFFNRVSLMQSASLDMGTQTSVDQIAPLGWSSFPA